MATLVVSNLTTSPVFVTDLYATVPASGSISTSRASSDLPRMASLQALIAAGTLAAAITYTAAEKASGLVDVGTPAPGASGIGDDDVIRIPFTALVAGTPDDVVLYALNALPYKKMRIVDAFAIVSTAIAATTLQVRTVSGGAGTLCAEMSSATAGRQGQTATVTASQVITNGASVGLFLRRSDRGVAGEIVITVRPET
jgi:hypothetical protein